MKKTTALYYLSALFLVFGLTMCAPKTKKKANTDTNTENSQIEAQIRKIVYPLPSAKEITDMLTDIEASYMIGTPNDPANAEKYALVSDQAINLGIYGTDLSYSATYKQSSAVSNYVKSCQTLINHLDIASAFGADILDRVESNLDNKEALTKEISDIFLYTYGALRNDKKPELASLILAGSWIEGMYLTTNISENTVQNTKIVSTILFQKQSFDLLLQNMSAEKDSPLCKDVYAQLLVIDSVFKSNPSEGSITQKELDNLTQQIAIVRNNMVKLK